MEIQSIFLRRLPAMHELHLKVRDQLLALEESYGTVLSLLDVVLAGPQIKKFEDFSIYLDYRAGVLEALQLKTEMPDLARYGVFSLPEISALNGSFRFLMKLDGKTLTKAIRSEPAVNPHELAGRSAVALSASPLLSIKYYLLYWEKEKKFEGILPPTMPVRNAMHLLFGTDFGGCAVRSTMFQQRLAAEIAHPDLDALGVNSVLWLIGQNINNNR